MTVVFVTDLSIESWHKMQSYCVVMGDPYRVVYMLNLFIIGAIGFVEMYFAIYSVGVRSMSIRSKISSVAYCHLT